MSDATGKDTPTDGAESGEDTAVRRRGREEKELNEQAAEHRAEEKQGEQEAEAIERSDDPPPEPTDADQLRGEIAETRDDLGDTVEALAAKADVKAHARETVEEQRVRAQEKLDDATEQVRKNPVPVAAVAGGGLAVMVLLLLLKRRRR